MLICFGDSYDSSVSLFEISILSSILYIMYATRLFSWQFFEDVRQAISDILSKGCVSIVTGGTGLYLRWYVSNPDNFLCKLLLSGCTPHQFERDYSWFVKTAVILNYV